MNNSSSTFKSGIPLASLQAGEHPVIPYVFVTLSLLVNVIVIGVVSLSRQLHEPRHVYWAGISLAVVFYTGDWLVKAFISADTDYAACIVYKLTVCLSYPTLFSFLSLAGLDRYLAIKHYEWYKRKMTNRKAIGSMAGALVVNSAAFHSPYLMTDRLTLNDCYYDLTHALCFVGWSVALGIVNVVLQVNVFFVSIKTIRYYYSSASCADRRAASCIHNARHPVIVLTLNNKSAAETRRDFNHSAGMTCSNGLIDPESLMRYLNNGKRMDHIVNVTSKEVAQHHQCFPIRHRRRLTVERLDYRAAFILSVNVLPFLVCTIPLGLNTMAMCVCSQWRLECSDDLMLQTDAYLKYTVFTPCIVMPLMYMWSSREFQRAFVHFFRKIESRANSLNPSFQNRRSVNHLN